MEPELFPAEKQIPQWLADYFYIANAGNYSLKQMFYSEVKPVVLRVFGVHAGYDLQTIEYKCWTCGGTGKYYNGNTCYHCSNGIYSTRQFSLERFILNGRLYHIPCKEVVVEPVVNTIKGVITHETIDSKEAQRAFLILLWKYNKASFYNHLKEIIGKGISEESKRIKEIAQGLFRKDNLGDELPF